MATLRLITEQDFRTSRFGQLADQIEGSLSDVIAQAETHVERKLDRNLSVMTYVENYWPRQDTLFLKQRPLQEVLQIRRRAYYTNNWTVLPLETFFLNHDSGYVRDMRGGYLIGWQVEVSYIAGYETIPDDIKSAVILQTALFAYQDLEIYGVGDSKAPGIRYMQDDLDMLLKPYTKLKLVVQ